MLRRVSLALLLSTVAMGALAAAASADPVNAKNGLVLPATCGSQTVQVAVNGNGEFTPAHVIGSTAVFVPQAFNVTFEFTPTGGSTESETDTTAHHNPHGQLRTCAINFTQANPFGTLHLVGTVTGFFTPAR
jgi:opacity protein-like surface antigen